jgi:hypothetical protein
MGIGCRIKWVELVRGTAARSIASVLDGGHGI